MRLHGCGENVGPSCGLVRGRFRVILVSGGEPPGENARRPIKRSFDGTRIQATPTLYPFGLLAGGMVVSLTVVCWDSVKRDGLMCERRQNTKRTDMLR